MTMTNRITTKLHHSVLKVWHAWLVGSFVVAYVTADEDTYAMHLFAGYAVLAAIVFRLLAGLFAPTNSPLKLSLPSLKATKQWLDSPKGRHPGFAWLATCLLVIVGVSAATGAIADISTALEDPHETISEACLAVIFTHIGFVAYMYGGKSWLKAKLAAFNPKTEQDGHL